MGSGADRRAKRLPRLKSEGADCGAESQCGHADPAERHCRFHRAVKRNRAAFRRRPAAVHAPEAQWQLPSIGGSLLEALCRLGRHHVLEDPGGNIA